MGKVLLHARVTPATGGCSDTMMLSCTALGYLNVHTDSTAATGSLSQNLLYLGSNAINLGSGAISTGTQRITIATNDSNIYAMRGYASASASSLNVLDDWDETNRCAVNLIASQSGIAAGSGAISAATPRVTIATNDSLTTAIKNAVEIIDDAVLADAGTIGKGVLIQGAGSGADAGKVKNLLTGEGTLGSGVLRVNLATDDDAVASLGVIDDAYLADAGTIGKGVLIQGAGSGADAGKVKNLLTGEGTLGSGVLRVNLATDDDAVTSLGILDNVVGTTGSAVPSGQAVVQVGGSDGTNLRTIKTGTDGVAHANITYIGSAAIPAAGAAAVSYGMPIHVSDGTYSRRTLGDSNGAQYVLPYTVPTFEDATNGWAETRPRSHYSACSADTATVTVDGTTEGTADELLASTNVSTYRGFTIWVENLGATAFSHVYVYASRDGTNWVCVDAIKNATELVADTLAATSNGIAFSVTDNPGWQYVKCTATVAAGSTTATGAISYQM